MSLRSLYSSLLSLITPITTLKKLQEDLGFGKRHASVCFQYSMLPFRKISPPKTKAAEPKKHKSEKNEVVKKIEQVQKDTKTQRYKNSKIQVTWNICTSTQHIYYNLYT